jgi:hypothetical protein
MDNRNEIRGFPPTRRARITPEQACLLSTQVAGDFAPKLADLTTRWQKRRRVA